MHTAVIIRKSYMDYVVSGAVVTPVVIGLEPTTGLILSALLMFSLVGLYILSPVALIVTPDEMDEE